jgi:hypothetical protein
MCYDAHAPQGILINQPTFPHNNGEKWATGERFFLAHTVLSFMFTGRFVDDLFTIANALFKHLKYSNQNYGTLTGVYPHALTLTDARSGLGLQSGISMLDVSVRLSPLDGFAQLCTDLFDKRRAPEYNNARIIRFPHITSLLSKICKYNIIVSRFHHLRRIISNRSNFVIELARVMLELIQKGYLTSTLNARLCRCLKYYPGLYPNTSSTVLRWLFYLALYSLAVIHNHIPTVNWAAQKLFYMRTHYRYSHTFPSLNVS